MCDRHPIQCVIPPYLADQLAKSDDPKLRDLGLASKASQARFRAMRTLSSAMPRMMAVPSPAGNKHRLVYTADGNDQIPGKLVRSEGQKKSKDKAVNEAYDGAGKTYDFYDAVFGRNSLDDAGMKLISSVHVGEEDLDGKMGPMSNAFWNGEQMAYGDGDGEVFKRFTLSLDVIGHELTHGVVSFTSNLEYRAQPGALNEHFADVFGILVRKWANRTKKKKDTDWLIGRELWAINSTKLRGIRDMENPGTAYDHPDIGKDPQPAHMDKYYKGMGDNQGVHINSGIPNRAFVLVAKALGGHPWEKAGRIWYDTLRQLTEASKFADAKRVSVQVASGTFGSPAGTAVANAWKAVGVV